MSTEHLPFLKEIEKIRSFTVFGTGPESALIGTLLLDLVRMKGGDALDLKLEIEKLFAKAGVEVAVSEVNALVDLCERMKVVPQIERITLDLVYNVVSEEIRIANQKLRKLFISLFLLGIGLSVVGYYVVDRLLHPRNFKVTYFPNSTLTGLPFGEYYEPIPNYDWGQGAPKPGLPINFFSARYETTLVLDQESSIFFKVISDDGMRLILDGEKILDHWIPQDSIPRTITKRLPAGEHKILLEYFEAEVGAKLIFEISDETGKRPRLKTP